MSQIEISGLGEYEDRLKDLKVRGQNLLLELGQVLQEAQIEFDHYPRQYWIDWLSCNDLKLIDAERAIAAYDCFGPVCESIPISMIPVVARAGEEERSLIRSKVSDGQTLTAADIRSIIKDFRTICLGKRVWLGETTLAPGCSGIVEILDGSTIVVALDSGVRIPCFMKEVSIKPIEQGVLPLGLDRRRDSRGSVRSQLLEEEVVFLKKSLFLVFDSDYGWRGDLLKVHPNIEEWGIYQ